MSLAIAASDTSADITPQAIVAMVAIVVGILTTLTNFRWSARRTHSDRLWLRMAETYEAYLVRLDQLDKERYERMTSPVSDPFDADPGDPDDLVPTLNRLMIYGSETVLASVRIADERDREWRRAYAHWQEVMDPVAEERAAAADALRTWKIADAAGSLLRTLILREIRQGKPTTYRWVSKLRYQGGGREYPDLAERHGHREND